MELTDASIGIFKTELHEFSHLHSEILELKKQIKPIQDKIKELVRKKKELEFELCSTMELNELKQAELSDKNIVIETNVKKHLLPITQKILKDKMIDFFENGPGSELSFNSKTSADKGITLFEYIYSREQRDFKILKELKSKPI